MNHMSQLIEYDYKLPKELIAQFPLKERTDARLLLVDRTNRMLDHWHMRDLPDLLSPNDCLVLNDTRVVPARLLGYRTNTRGRWQGLYLEHGEDGLWKILCKARGRLVSGETIQLLDRDARPASLLHLGAKLDDGVWVARPDTDEDPFSLLDRIGRVPLPPYIRGGEMVDADLHTYQTVFAEHAGSVAAPTAGLHFTNELLAKTSAKGIRSCKITLHVGRDTFRPIRTERLDEHQIHSEYGTISSDTAQALQETRQRGGRIVAVGTTSVRILETAMQSGAFTAWQGSTNLFIRPPFQFQAVDALITNFHLPRTSLLVLVHAFGGREVMKNAYEAALDEKYRFYSYGDAMLIL